MRRRATTQRMSRAGSAPTSISCSATTAQTPRTAATGPFPASPSGISWASRCCCTSLAAGPRSAVGTFKRSTGSASGGFGDAACGFAGFPDNICFRPSPYTRWFMARESDITARPPAPAVPSLNGPPAPDPKAKPMDKTKGKGKGKDKPDEPRDSLREIAETVVFVVVLVLMLKTFVAEAFVIPTGSMAETLYGYQKIVTCDQCGQVFPVNCSSEVDPSNGVFSDITGCHCPNCEYKMDWGSKANGPSWGSGDRVLVAKFLYDDDHLWAPKRGQVFVFKYSGESNEFSDDIRGGPQKSSTAMNYIKRCMGEPQETVALFGGDLYFTKKLKYADAECDPNDLWKKKYVHKNDAAAIELFRESLKRREAGESMSGDFEIFRKPPPLSMSMRRIVFNNDHQPVDLKGKMEFRRWRDDGNTPRWAGDDRDMPRTFTHAGNAGHTADAWLTYGHRLRLDHHPTGMPKAPPPNPPDFKNDPRKLITNMMGYNTGLGDGNQDVTGSEWVGDLMLDLTVEVTSAEGEFLLELAKGPDRFQARFDVTSGNCKLLRISTPGADSADGQLLAEKTTTLKGTGSYHVRFANFDERLTLWVDRHL